MLKDGKLVFSLHPGQLEIFNAPQRFIAVAAGRRFGKSYLAAVKLLIEGLKEENDDGFDLQNTGVYYVAPTFQQAKDIMWNLLKRLGHGVIEQAYENTAVLKLINGRCIYLKGSDRPETLRGVGLSYVVMDEYAYMRPEVWEQIIRPTLADVRGGALFIGTPAGKNHFYDLFLDFKREDNKNAAVFEFKSIDNPFLPDDEVENARDNLSAVAFRQEFEASFASGGGDIFKADYFKDVIMKDEPSDGFYFITVDPAGYEAVAKATNSKHKRLDETAIAVVKVTPSYWWVKKIDTGRWDVRETALKILRTAQVYKPLAVGIEKGMAKNALMPYLNDTMKRLNVFIPVQDLTHGGKKKDARIAWALQGRLEHGRIKFAPGDYLPKLVEQAMDFPSPLSHDDMLDALAYIDQIAIVCYGVDTYKTDWWKPLDPESGY